jgi:hypothetical protein
MGVPGFQLQFLYHSQWISAVVPGVRWPRAHTTQFPQSSVAFYLPVCILLSTLNLFSAGNPRCSVESVRLPVPASLQDRLLPPFCLPTWRRRCKREPASQASVAHSAKSPMEGESINLSSISSGPLQDSNQSLSVQLQGSLFLGNHSQFFIHSCNKPTGGFVK